MNDGEDPLNSDPTARYRAGNGALFSSTKCPPAPDLASQCELPFGVIWTPFSPPDIATNTPAIHTVNETLPPVLCLTCLCYLNLYSDVCEEDGTWVCGMCGARNVLSSDVEYAQMASPTVEYRQRMVPTSSAEPCDASTLVVVMDENLPRSDAQAVGNALQTHLTNHGENLKIGLIVFGKTITIYQLGVSGMASGDTFTTRQTVDERYFQTRSYLTDASHNVQSFMRCLAAVYGIVVEDDSGLELEPENRPMSRMEMLKKRKEARMLKQQQQKQPTPVSASLAKSPWEQLKARDKPALRCTGAAIQMAIDLATSGHDPSRTSRIVLFTNGCPNYGDASCVSEDYRSATATASHLRKRADIVDPMRLQRAVEYFGVVSKAASEFGVAIDVFCSGALELALPAYNALVEPSSGYVLSSLSFTETQFASNLEHLLQQTFVAGLHGLPLRDENWIDGCIVDIRMPSFFSLTHLVGPGELIDEARGLLVNERSGFAVGASLAATKRFPTNQLPVGDMVESTLVRIRLGRFDPLTTISIMLRLNEFFQHESHAIFQFVARYVDRDGRTLVTRAVTHRLAIAKETVEYLDAVDEEVVPVLLAKEAVSRSMMGRELRSQEEGGGSASLFDSQQVETLAMLAQRDLDATIQRISGAFRLLGLEKGSTMRGLDLTEEGGVKAAGSSLDFAFPPELADALQRLYHFRRGPLLSPGPMQSDDDRSEIRSLFIRLPLDDCLSMMALSLWSSGPLDGDAVPSMFSVPPDTLALWDNCILAGDHSYVLFVWSGRATLEDRFDAVREQLKNFLLRRSRNRFPLPTLYMLQENDSMSRRFTALLSPSHGDPFDHQVSNFPALSQLSMEKLSALKAKFKFYDPETDASFRNWFWNVASASSSCKDEGVSLCE